jgi:hypothetical protein
MLLRGHTITCALSLGSPRITSSCRSTGNAASSSSSTSRPRESATRSATTIPTTATPKSSARTDGGGDYDDNNNGAEESPPPRPSTGSSFAEEKPITPAPDGGRFETLMERALQEEARGGSRHSASPSQRSDGSSPSKKPFLRRGQVSACACVRSFVSAGRRSCACLFVFTAPL